jgi:hypothetical protein
MARQVQRNGVGHSQHGIDLALPQGVAPAGTMNKDKRRTVLVKGPAPRRKPDAIYFLEHHTHILSPTNPGPPLLLAAPPNGVP